MKKEDTKYFFKFHSFGKYKIECLNHLMSNEIYASNVKRLNDPFENYWEPLPGIEFEAINKEFKKRVDEKRGVYCMCSSHIEEFPLMPESFLMWAHYANANTGFCIAYSSDILNAENQVANRDNQIYYSDDVPGRVTESYGKNADKELHRILHQKPKCWEYEHEVRLVFEQSDRYYKIPKGCIIGIFCGLNIDDKNKDLIRKTAIHLNVPFYSLGLESDKYRFVAYACTKKKV